MIAETEPTSVGLAADQVLTLLATWMREQGLKARSLNTLRHPDGHWSATFVVADDDLDEWSWALEVPFRVASNGSQWWHTLDNLKATFWFGSHVDGIRITVDSDMHAGPIPPELAAGDQSWSLRKDAERAESEYRAYVAMAKGESDPDSRSELLNKAIDLGELAKRLRAEINRLWGGRS